VELLRNDNAFEHEMVIGIINKKDDNGSNKKLKLSATELSFDDLDIELKDLKFICQDKQKLPCTAKEYSELKKSKYKA